MNYLLLLIPLLTAFTGWLVIYLIVRMIFKPVIAKKLAGFTWQGIIPAKKQQIADRISQLVAAEFSGFARIEQKVSDPRNFETVRPLIETHIDDFLRNKLKEQMPMIAMFIGDKTMDTLKTIFIKEIETLFPQVMQQFAGNLKNELNLEQMLSSGIAGISSERINNLLYSSISKEIRNASLFGAAIGLLIGLVQLLLILLIR